MVLHYTEVSLSFTSIHLHPSSFNVIHLPPFSFTFIHLSTFIHFHPLLSTLIHFHLLPSSTLLCGSRKYPSPPPPTEDHWKFRGGGGGFKGSNFRGVGGFMGNFFSKGWRAYDQSEAQKHTYIRCFETKVNTPGHWDEVNIISFNVSVFFELASTTISRRMMCL